MIHILLTEGYETSVDAGLLVSAAEAVVALQKADPQAELTIVVETDEYLRELNHQFLGIDTPTDVLSFPADEIDPESGLRYLGDIIISYPRALEQATAAGETVAEEMQLLVVHGTLHLLGFDHGEAEEKAAMWAAQQQALDQIGCKIRRLPEA
jgi:probable rRNA maturation factor